MDVSIIIVNWNVRELLYRCLRSIFLFTQQVNFEIIVVDNHSYDGSLQMLESFALQHPNMRVISNGSNRGFSAAHNQGLAVAQGRYVLCMNPDMEFVENTPFKLMRYVGQRPDVGVSTCQLLYNDGTRQPNIKRNPTLLSQIWILYKLHHFWQPPFVKRYLAKDFDYNYAQPVEQIMGAFVFMRRELMQQLGGWSEDYFIWWEDVDLCKRLQLAGQPIHYVPDSRVIHHESKSFAQQRSLEKQKRFNRGLLTYFKKYHSTAAWLVLKLVSLDSLVLAWLVQMFKVKPRTQSKL